MYDGQGTSVTGSSIVARDRRWGGSQVLLRKEDGETIAEAIWATW